METTTTTGGNTSGAVCEKCPQCGKWINANEMHLCCNPPKYSASSVTDRELLEKIVLRLDQILEMLRIGLR